MWPSHTLHCLQCSLAPGLTTSRAGSGCGAERTSCLSPTRSCSRFVWCLPLALLPYRKLPDPCQLPTSPCTGGNKTCGGLGMAKAVTIGRWSKCTQDQMGWPQDSNRGKAARRVCSQSSQCKGTEEAASSPSPLPLPSLPPPAPPHHPSFLLSSIMLSLM